MASGICPVTSLLFGFCEYASCHTPTYYQFKWSWGGLVSPSRNLRMQPTARPPPPGAQGGSILIDACHRALLIVFLGVGLDV